MTRRVLFYSHLPLHQYPPFLSEICILRDLGVEVVVLTTQCSREVRDIFDARGVICETYSYKIHPNKLIQKGMNYLFYRRLFRRFFARYWTDNSVFWCGDEESAMRMRPYLRRVRPYIQSCLEFYEREAYQRVMPAICRGADVVTACEPHRADYMVDWWNLKTRPHILPNKPYIHPRGRFLEGSTPEMREIISRIRGKTCLVYMGVIRVDRDLRLLARALQEAGSEDYLVLCGSNDTGHAEQLQAIYPRTIYLGNIPAPLHLEVASHATIGVAFYVDDCINNRYCAPNKIYEYAGSGVPMLCNNIPGLTETVGKAGAGECVDFRDSQAILAAIRRIQENYSRYSQAATRFYEETDNTGTIQRIADQAFSLTKAERT